MSVVEGLPFLLASAGGHIRELIELAGQWNLRPGEAIWGTSRGRQLDQLREMGWDVVEVPLCPQRSFAALPRAFLPARRILADLKPSGIVTTGSSVAIPFLIAARMAGIPATFIESVTRQDGPSTTGKLMEFVPGVELRTQSHDWMRRTGPFARTWSRTITALDGMVAGPEERKPRISRIFAAAGVATRTHSFDRLFETLAAVVPEGVLIRVQGCRPGISDKFELLPVLAADELSREILTADAVIIHAGVGLSLDCFELGRSPLVVPRDPAFGEHVDGHQFEYARILALRGLATIATIEQLTWEAIQASAQRSIIRRKPELSELSNKLAGLLTVRQPDAS